MAGPSFPTLAKLVHKMRSLKGRIKRKSPCFTDKDKHTSPPNTILSIQVPSTPEAYVQDILSSQRPMHQALLISEILNEIFSRCSKHTLLQTALVCHAWSDVALDEIWRDVTIGTFASLLQIVAPLVPRGGVRELGLGLEELSEDKLARFDLYAGRIRVFKYHAAIKFHDSVYETLHRYRPIILPNLTAFNAWIEEPSIMHRALHFITNNRVEVMGFDLQNDHNMHPEHIDPAQINQFLVNLAKYSSSVKDFRWCCDLKLASSGMLNLGPCFESMPHLKTIKIPDYTFTDNDLLLLASSPTLEVLEGGFKPSQCEFYQCNRIPAIPLGKNSTYTKAEDSSFVKLKKLNTFLPIAALRNTLEHPRARHIEELFLGVSDCAHVYEVGGSALLEGLQEMTSLAASRCSNVKGISVGVHAHREGQGTFEFTLLEPLLACSQLTSLIVLSNGRSSLVDTDIERLAKALPMLETFVVMLGIDTILHRYMSETPLMTMKSLTYFAGHQHIKTIGLYVDAGHKVSEGLSHLVQTCVSEELSFTGLKHLDLSQSRLGDPGIVASLLAALLKNSPEASLVGKSLFNRWYGDMWAEVEKLMIKKRSDARLIMQ